MYWDVFKAWRPNLLLSGWFGSRKENWLLLWGGGVQRKTPLRYLNLEIVRQTEISPHIMIRKKTNRLPEFDLHSKRYFLWNISVRPWTGLETCQTWCNICLVPRRMFEALFCLWSLWTIIQSSHMIPISLVHWKMNIQQFHIYITKLNVSTEEI